MTLRCSPQTERHAGSYAPARRSFFDARGTRQNTFQIITAPIAAYSASRQRICVSESGIVSSSIVALVGSASWRDHSAIRGRSHVKSADSFRPVRTELSEPLSGRCVEQFGAITQTPMSPRSAAAIRDPRAVICPEKFQSRQNFSQPSTSNWSGALNEATA